MIGRSAGEVSRPSPRTWQLGEKPVLELRNAAVGRALVALRAGAAVAIELAGGS